MNLLAVHGSDREAVKCGAAKTTAVVLASGNVVPCAAFKQTDRFVAGNILEESFRSVWDHGRSFEELRAFEYSKAGGDCGQCSVLAKSEGLCHAQRFAVSGSIYHGHDPHCASNLLQIETRKGVDTDRSRDRVIVSPA
jgi:radical SAM protein with 4Fe4S-binding SPASM domain